MWSSILAFCGTQASGCERVLHLSWGHWMCVASVPAAYTSRLLLSRLLPASSFYLSQLKGSFWSITGTRVMSREFQGRCDGLWRLSIWQNREKLWRQASGRSYVKGVKKVRLIDVGRLTLNVGNLFHGLESQTTCKRERKKSMVILHFLLPDCLCDMTSCFMPLLPPMPCHDELPLGLWTKIAPSFLKLCLSGIFPQQLDQ